MQDAWDSGGIAAGILQVPEALMINTSTLLPRRLLTHAGRLGFVRHCRRHPSIPWSIND